MNPKTAAFISKTIGTIIILLTGSMYILQISKEPIEKISSLGLAAFGVVASLSALCFTLVPCIESKEEKHNPMYAGEKFLHSSLLLIQTIFLKFASESLISYELIININWLLISIKFLAAMLTFVISSYSIYFFYWGFEALNYYLWNRYEARKSKYDEEKRLKKK